MITRALLLVAAGVGLSACQPAIPDSGRGVGFDSSFEAQQYQRDAALAASVPAPVPVAAMPLDDGSPEATAAETARVLAATRPGGAPIIASPSNPAPPVLNPEGISQENSFDAVSAERGIEGDAARIAANRAQYEVIQPEALPDRADTGPNIVAYALANKHPVGTQIYSRRGLNKAAKFARACAQFARADDAQIEFLSQGGPERDRAGMDPDGDGYACNWNPAPYRKGLQG